MYRLRRFNESNEKRYPIQINQEEFFKKKSLFRMVDWSDSQRRVLFEILDDKRSKRYSFGYSFDFSISSEFVEISSSSGYFYEIVKLEDDWFTIIKQGRWKGVGDEYFLGDEFEEVVNFLKNPL
jgi:hypothetical protein